jgi:2-haloacid dehalogenase
MGVSAPRLGFASSNPWDVFGAHVFGLRAFWVNRGGRPDEYRLRGVVPEVADLSDLVTQPDLG